MAYGDFRNATGASVARGQANWITISTEASWTG